MAGQVHTLIQKIIKERSNGNASLALATSTKLLMKGIDQSKWNAGSPDDVAMIAKVKAAAGDLGVKV